MKSRVYACPQLPNTYLVCFDHDRWTLAVDSRVFPVHVTSISGSLSECRIATVDAMGREVVILLLVDRVRLHWGNAECVLHLIPDGHELAIAHQAPKPRGARRLDMVVARKATTGEPVFMLLAEMEWEDITHIAVRLVQSRFAHADRVLIPISQCLQPSTRIRLCNTRHVLHVWRHIQTQQLGTVALVPATDDTVILERPNQPDEVQKWLRRYRVPPDRYQIPYCSALADEFFYVC